MCKARFCLCAALLLLLFAAKKTTAAAYAALLGYYPVLFADLARVKSVPLRAVLKLLIFEGVAAAAYLAAKYMIGLDSFAVLQAAEARGFSQKTVVIGVLVLYHIGIAAYEGFLWIYYKLFHKKLASRLRSAVRRR